MAQVGDAKGEFRGTTVRNDADLKAWLAKRPTEAALEPDLPIIDPHHHFWDTPQRGRYFLPELLADIGGGHNIVSTVFLECRAMYRKDGPREMAPVGEVEFVNGIAAMSASGTYGPCRVAEGIIGHGDLTLGARVREVLEAQIAVGGGRFRGIRHGVSWDGQRSVGKFASRVVPPHQVRDPKFREGFAQLAPLGLSFEVLAVSSATTGRDRPRARVPRHHDHPEPCRRRARRGSLCRQAAGNPCRLAQGYRRAGEMPERQLSSWAASAWSRSASTSMNATCRHRPKTSPPAWRQYIEPCIEAFGVNRCMFESNFPPDKQSCGYTELWNAFKRITAGASASEKTALYSGTAARVYRLTVP